MKIVSASRRTDIPAFYADWFMNRIRAGFVRVPNPFNARQVATVSLDPRNVACVIFWTRDPRPLLPSLDELDERGFRYLFHVTATGLPEILEPSAPTAEAAVEAVLKLSQRLGPERVIWRFDPILISNLTPPERIAENFDRFSEKLAGAVKQVMVSFVQPYPRALSRMKRLAPQVEPFFPQGVQEKGAIMAALARVAASRRMNMTACAAAKDDLSPSGVDPGKCIDPALIKRLWGIEVGRKKDAGQREGCGCAKSIDIGVYGTCSHGCLYCYASCSNALKSGRHDPQGETLLIR